MSSTDSQPNAQPQAALAASLPVFPPGFPREFGRKYTLLKELGAGGMGRIYLAVSGAAGVQRVCVVKALALEPDEPDTHDLRTRFVDEARVVVQLSNENLVYVFDAGIEGDEPYLAMEHIQGKTLEAVWNRCAERQAPFSLGTAMYVVLEILSGLTYVHGFQGLGLVHRDISPSNVMLSYAGGVKLIDFGVAKWRDRLTRTHTGIQWGRNSYKAPEQHLGGDVDERADLFSVGVMFWELLAGRQLFPPGQLRPLRPEIPPPSTQNPEVPAELDAIALRATAIDRSERYQSARLFHMALARYLRGGDAKAKLGSLVSTLFEREIAAEERETAHLASQVTATLAPAAASAKGGPSDPDATRRAPVDAPLVGAVLEERYKVRRLLGRGAMGVVYEGYHQGIGKRVAIKLPNPNERDPDVVSRLMVEAQAAGRIEHPNVARVTDCGRTPDGAFFIVMDYVEGVGLDRAIHREAPLALARAAAIAVQIARALHAAHASGIVHRDLKPSNVMLARGGAGEEIVRVLDFGLAKVAGLDRQSGAQDDLTRPEETLGTPRYMAPEQIAKGDVVDHRADLYALGVIFYELLTRHAPFEAGTVEIVCRKKVDEEPKPITDWNSELPGGVSALVMKLLARAPADRPQSAAEIEPALAAIASDALTARSRATERVAHVPSAGRRRRALALGAAAGAAVGLLVAVLVVARARDQTGAGRPDAPLMPTVSRSPDLPTLPAPPSRGAAVPQSAASITDRSAAAPARGNPPPAAVPSGSAAPPPLAAGGAATPGRAEALGAGAHTTEPGATAEPPRPRRSPPQRSASDLLSMAEDEYRNLRSVQAKILAERALRLEPSSTEAHLMLGKILLDMKRLPEAAKHYEAVLKVHPDNRAAKRGFQLASP